MLNYKIYLGAILLMVSLTACIKTVSELNYPDATTKLVVSSIISPEQPKIIVRVIKSKPFFNNATSNTLVNNAIVIISGENKSIQLTYVPVSINGTDDPEASFYSADSSEFSINPGVTYSLSITTSDGLSVKAKCTVPSAIVLKAVNMLGPIVDSLKTSYPVELTWETGMDMILYFFSADAIQKNRDTQGDTTIYKTFSDVGAIIHPDAQENIVTATFYGYKYVTRYGFEYNTTLTDIRFQIFDLNMYQAYVNAINANKYNASFDILNPPDNKFINPMFTNSGYEDIILPGINIAPGSVTVRAGSQVLQEGVDYTIDYNLGRIRIINLAIITSGQPITYTYKGENGSASSSDPSYFVSDSTTIPYEDNLFSEPSNYFTNLEGGFGIFGAYNSSKVELK